MKARIKKLNLVSNFILTLVAIVITVSNATAQVTEEWVSRLNKFNLDDIATSMTTDNDGAVYITGSSVNKDGDNDILTVKYSSSGKQIWEATYSGDGIWNNRNETANAIAVDDKGNVYVTGTVPVPGNSMDLILLKYNPRGDEEFVALYSGSGIWDNCNETGVDLAVDLEGNVVVAGHSNGIFAENGYDILVIKYTAAGSIEWVNSFDGGYGDDFAKRVVTDSEGDIVVCGVLQQTHSGKDYFTAKISKGGRILWTSKYNGTGGNALANDDEINDMHMDASGNVYVTGYSDGLGSGRDFLSIKYDPAGNEMWVSRINNLPIQKGIEYDDEATSVSVDASGNVIVTGRTFHETTGSSIFSAKLNERGEKQWSRVFDTYELGFSDDGGVDLSTDELGNVYVAGYITGADIGESCARGKDIATLKYSGNGDFKWMKRYNGVGRFENSDDIPIGIELDSRGGIYVAAASTGEDTEMDYCLIKYSERFPAGKVIHDKREYLLNDNFPNPFNPTTNISFNIPSASNVRLAIYDMTGREVELLANKVLQPGSYKYEWDASRFSSGTYFYKITADGFVQTKKMLLIK